MAGVPEVDFAIQQITDAAIVQSNEDQDIVEINLEKLKAEGFPPDIIELIEGEFKEILRLLEFDKNAYEMFRSFYVDGRLYFHAMIDPAAPNAGLLAVRRIDPRKIRKVREVIKVNQPVGGGPLETAQLQQLKAEYYVYNENAFENQGQTGAGGAYMASATAGLKIAKDAIVYVNSGVTDVQQKVTYSWLHKAIKALNQLTSLEEASIIYRMARAPERRVFYVDTGKLPRMQAEAVLRNMMTQNKNKLTYNVETGAVGSDRTFTAMTEDYWFARREGSTGTQVETLDGGKALSEMSDVSYFLEKLMKSLNIPFSRTQPSDAMFNSRATEITRDEVAFSYFIDRLRFRFNDTYLQLLEKQLVLKNIILADEWAIMKGLIRFGYAKDNMFAEFKEAELMDNRIARASAALPLVPVALSIQWIRRNILKQTDEDMEMIDYENSINQDNVMLLATGGGGDQGFAQGLPPSPRPEDEITPGVSDV